MKMANLGLLNTTDSCSLVGCDLVGIVIHVGCESVGQSAVASLASSAWILGHGRYMHAIASG